MDEQSGNNHISKNIDKRYELLHAAREYSFDSYLTDVDYKQPILIKEINRTVRLHASEQNLRVYFYLLALIDTFKIMVNAVRGDDRVVFGGINDEDIRGLIEADSIEDQIIHPNTEIGSLFLAIVFHAANIRGCFPDYTLHPYVQIVLDENIDQVVASIEQNLTIRASQFIFIPETERKFIVHDFIVKAKNIAGKIDDLLLRFIERLHSSAIKNRKDVFDKKGDRSVERLNEFIHYVKNSKSEINFVFRLSLSYSESFYRALKCQDESLCANIFNRSLSDFDVKLRKNKKCIKPTKVFHMLKSSKSFGLYTDSYFIISFNNNGIPFSKEQIALWCAASCIFSDFLKETSLHNDFKKISDYFNSNTGKGVDLEAVLKDIKRFYKNKKKSKTYENDLNAMISVDDIKDKTSFMLLQKNFELCAFIDGIKSMWSDIVADNIRSDLIFSKEPKATILKNENNKPEVIDYRCAGTVLVRDIFEVENGEAVSLTQCFAWRPKYDFIGPLKTKDWMNDSVVVRLLYMQPFFKGKAKSRSFYKNNTKSFTYIDDLFGATTRRLIAELKFLKLNLKVGNRQLDEIRTVNCRKPNG